MKIFFKKVFVLFLIIFCVPMNAFPLGSDTDSHRAPSEVIKTDDDFLDLLQYKIVHFFLNEVDVETGLVKDRANNFTTDQYTTASIASVGFALPAYVIAKERHWISEKEAYRRVLKTLQFFNDSIENKEGFYYHFVQMHTGERAGQSEISSIDTALFMAGVLFVRQYYAGTEVEKIATALYTRVNWLWMLNDGKTFSMGWAPSAAGGSFLPARWKHYDESMLLYLLAIGAPLNPVPSAVWDNISRTVGRYGDHILIQSTPLFTHQYAHAFIDFKNKHDAYADYFANSVSATLANREFCIDMSGEYKTYGENVWGLTACDGPFGYKAYGAKPGYANHDGTVAPTAAGASIVFTPEYSVKALRFMYDTYKEKLWGRYGFSDSFNIDKAWYASDVIGIDQGAMLLMIENYRSGLIWQYFMKNPEVNDAMAKAGFREGTYVQKMPAPIEIDVKQRMKNIFIDGDLSEWQGLEGIELAAPRYLEFGEVLGPDDFSSTLRFLWDDEYLFFCAEVRDDILFTRRSAEAIYKNDCLEFFFDPEGNGLEWNNPKDVQIGMSPRFNAEVPYVNGWAWFQNVDPVKSKDLMVSTTQTDGGYIIEGALRWSFVQVSPQTDAVIPMSPAFNDVDQNGKNEAKVNLFFQDVTGKDALKKLARMKLRAETF